MKRNSLYAGSFYPESKSECEAMFAEFSQQTVTTKINTICAGIVPHAGWVYSGYTSYLVFNAIKKEMLEPETFVVFGAIHVPGVYKASTWRSGGWKTPFGVIDLDSSVVEQIIATDLVEVNEDAHINEHSIEVLVPFIQHFFPQAKLVPIMIPVQDSAFQIGKKIADICKDKKTVAIASTDLTHYGTRFGFSPKGTGIESLEWVKKENDKRIIDLMLDLEDDKIIKEVRQNNNACGAGAIAATLAFAKEQGKSTGQLLDYTTSWDIYPQGQIDNFVGYSGIVF